MKQPDTVASGIKVSDEELASLTIERDAFSTRMELPADTSGQ
jgi:hypothetical protein